MLMAALLIWAEKNYTRTDMPRQWMQWNKHRSTAKEKTAAKRVEVMWLDVGITKAIDADDSFLQMNCKGWEGLRDLVGS